MRRFLIAVGLALVFAAPAAARPNVILIVTDDQRWDTLGYMPTVTAELVDKGVTFTNAYTVSPLCCPSRASILTGQFPHTHGVWGNKSAGEFGGMAAFDDSSTLPVWLRQGGGYETYLIGKYLDAQPNSLYVPPGWSRWLSYFGQNLYFNYQLSDGETVRSYGAEPADYATDVLGQEATRFIRESGNHPFFLYFAPKAPHITADGVSRFSVDLPPRHIGFFAGLELPWPDSVNEEVMSDKPRYLRTRSPVPAEGLAELREEQLESLLAVDDAIADMLDALKDTGKLTDTLIVFTSDNGYSWGEHRWVQKNVPYDESIRVPLVIRYDQLGLPPRQDDRYALNIDLAQTITDAAGLTVEGRQGRSLLPLMANAVSSWRQSFLVEHYDASGVPSYCSIHDADWKYVQYRTGEEELYNVTADPLELRNVLFYGWQRPLMMSFRARIRSSRCRPPGYTPLPLCTRIGTPNADSLEGTPRRDWICAGAGPDRIDVRGGGSDVVRCGSGFDRVRAGSDDQLISCEQRGY